MADTKEVPPNDPNARAGYTFDPYSDPCQLNDIHAANIPFHNYRQIHVSEVAWGEGIKAVSLTKLPECPPMWQDVQHYWVAASFAGYLCQEFLSSQLWVKIVAAVPLTLLIQWGLGFAGIHISL